MENERIKNGTQVYITGGYWAGQFAMVEGYHYERKGYSVAINNADRTAFIPAYYVEVANA